jgi:hypothetical protein
MARGEWGKGLRLVPGRHALHVAADVCLQSVPAAGHTTPEVAARGNSATAGSSTCKVADTSEPCTMASIWSATEGREVE